MAKKYTDYDRSTPEKRGYAARKAFFEGDPDHVGGGTNIVRKDTVNNMYGTGPEQNIGMLSDIVSKTGALPGETLTSSKKREGRFEAGWNKAKAEANAPIGPDFSGKKKPASDAAKPKPAAIKPLKDTSDQYWSPSDSDSGNYGSATGEIGPNMGQVNKGGYDPSEGMKRGGKIDGHMQHRDALKKHSGGFKHNSEHSSKHAAGFKPFHEHVKSMCKGGKTK